MRSGGWASSVPGWECEACSLLRPALGRQRGEKLLPWRGTLREGGRCSLGEKGLGEASLRGGKGSEFCSLVVGA